MSSRALIITALVAGACRSGSAPSSAQADVVKPPVPGDRPSSQGRRDLDDHRSASDHELCLRRWRFSLDGQLRETGETELFPDVPMHFEPFTTADHGLLVHDGRGGLVMVDRELHRTETRLHNGDLRLAYLRSDGHALAFPDANDARCTFAMLVVVHAVSSVTVQGSSSAFYSSYRASGHPRGRNARRGQPALRGSA
jgi:hypothetical protein